MNSIRRRPPNTSFAFISPMLPPNCFPQPDNSVHCLSSDGKIVGKGVSLGDAQADLKMKMNKTTTHPSSMVTHHVVNPNKHPSIKHVTHSVTKVTPASKPVEKMTFDPLGAIGKGLTDAANTTGKAVGDFLGLNKDKSADSNKIAPTVLKDTKNVAPAPNPVVVKKVTPAHPATIKPLNNTIVAPAPVSPFLQTALDNGKALSQPSTTTTTSTTTTAPTVNAPAAGDITQPPAPPGGDQGPLGGNNMLIIGGIVVVGLVLILAVR